MNITSKIMRFAMAALLVTAAAACSDDDENVLPPDEPGQEEPEPDPDPSDDDSVYPTNPNTFVVDGAESTVGTVFANVYESYILMTASPATVETYDQILEEKYIQVMLLPNFLNQDIDLTQQSVTINMWDGENMPLTLTSDMLQSGQCRIDQDTETNQCTLLLSMTMADGTEVGVNASAPLTDLVPEVDNTITVNGSTEPVRAQFYMDDGTGLVALYFTSAAIDYFGEIGLAEDYFCVMLNEDDLTGNTLDISTLDSNFAMFYMNQRPNEESSSVAYGGGELDGATGTLAISRDATDPTRFTADIDVTFGDGNAVAVQFDGTCLSVDYEPETPELPNEFTVMGATESIKSILVDKSDAEIWHVYFSATPGLATVEDFVADWAFHITAPADAFDGQPAGFSTYKDTLKFEYDGNTWDYDDGNGRGTFTATLEGDQLTMDFTTYGDVVGHYQGTAIVVE